MPEEIEKKFLLSENGIEFITNELHKIYSSMEALKKDVLANGTPIKQGYLPLETGEEIAKLLGMGYDFKPNEARLRDKGGKLYFTIKGKGGVSRSELEEKLTQKTFDRFWQKTEGKRVGKIRKDVKLKYKTLNSLGRQKFMGSFVQYLKDHKISFLDKLFYSPLTAEIDVYTDRELIVAEIEVPTIEIANSLIPLGKDVSEDSNYKNKNLAK